MDLLKQQQLFEEALKESETLFEHTKEGLKCFQKKKYPVCFEELMNQYREYFSKIEKTYLEESQNTWVLEAVSDAFVECASSKVKACRWKFLQENMQADLNVFLVVYVIPMILEYEFTMRESFADTLLAKWNDTFHTKLEAGRYEQICDGFKIRIFGISLGEGK